MVLFLFFIVNRPLLTPGPCGQCKLREKFEKWGSETGEGRKKKGEGKTERKRLTYACVKAWKTKAKRVREV
jgi:hypothetical protein